MSALETQSLKVVLYEGPGSKPLDPGLKSSVLLELLNDGVAVQCLSSGSEITTGGKEPFLILGDFEGGPIRRSEELDFLDLSGLSAEDALGRVKEAADERFSTRRKWKPWFPVIDYDRCTNCMQCLTFCLFDVYKVKEGTITVANEDNCKTDCPACSRVCPEVAILFPKYTKGPINGDVVREEDIHREKMKVDISSLLGGDILNRLRERSTDAKKRFSKERDEGKALRERKRCLAKLKKELDIPDEVLNALPTSAMIEAKTRLASDE